MREIFILQPRRNPSRKTNGHRGIWTIVAAALVIGSGLFVDVRVSELYQFQAIVSGSNRNDSPRLLHKHQTRRHHQQNQEFLTNYGDFGLTLPQTIYTITGLESSGTNFVSKIVAQGLGKGGFRQANMGGPSPKHDVWVQHVSLPSGGSCAKYPLLQLQPVVLPPACSSRKDAHYDINCVAAAKSANVTIYENHDNENDNYDSENGKSNIGRAVYPNRYFLDLVANKEWYQQRSVRQIYIIVVRDKTISRKGRIVSGYCANETLSQQEEDFGTAILEETIQKYLLEDGDDANNNNHDEDTALLSSGGLLSNSKHDVVLVSYESLVKFQNVYVKLLFRTLGLDTDCEPEGFSDGNAKYIHSTMDQLLRDNHEKIKEKTAQLKQHWEETGSMVNRKGPWCGEPRTTKRTKKKTQKKKNAVITTTKPKKKRR